MPPSRSRRAIGASGSAFSLAGAAIRGNQAIVEPLVIALEMIVLGELGDREAEVAFTERNELVKAFGFDREHEALRDRIQVRALRRQLEAPDAGRAKDRAKRLSEQRVAVMDQVALASQDSVDAVGQV